MRLHPWEGNMTGKQLYVVLSSVACSLANSQLIGGGAIWLKGGCELRDTLLLDTQSWSLSGQNPPGIQSAPACPCIPPEVAEAGFPLATALICVPTSYHHCHTPWGVLRLQEGRKAEEATLRNSKINQGRAEGQGSYGLCVCLVFVFRCETWAMHLSHLWFWCFWEWNFVYLIPLCIQVLVIGVTSTLYLFGADD